MVIDGTTGRLKAINNTDSGVYVKVDQTFMWYSSSDGINVPRDTSKQASGAYIFRYTHVALTGLGGGREWLKLEPTYSM